MHFLTDLAVTAQMCMIHYFIPSDEIIEITLSVNYKVNEEYRHIANTGIGLVILAGSTSICGLYMFCEKPEKVHTPQT